MMDNFDHVTNNIIAEAARKGFNRSDIYRALGWSYGPWKRRAERPEEWTIGELVRVAATLGVPLYALLGSLIGAYPRQNKDGSITIYNVPSFSAESAETVDAD